MHVACMFKSYASFWLELCHRLLLLSWCGATFRMMCQHVFLCMLGLMLHSLASEWAASKMFVQGMAMFEALFLEVFVFVSGMVCGNSFSGGKSPTVSSSTFTYWSGSTLPVQFFLPLLVSLLYGLMFARAWRKSLLMSRGCIGRRTFKRLQRCAPQVLYRLKGKQKHVSIHTDHAHVAVWTIYFTHFGVRATGLHAWLSAALALQFLYSGVHARTPSECRLCCAMLCVLAARDSCGGQFVGICMLSLIHI